MIFVCRFKIFELFLVEFLFISEVYKFKSLIAVTIIFSLFYNKLGKKKHLLNFFLQLYYSYASNFKQFNYFRTNSVTATNFCLIFKRQSFTKGNYGLKILNDLKTKNMF